MNSLDIFTRFLQNSNLEILSFLLKENYVRVALDGFLTSKLAV